MQRNSAIAAGLVGAAVIAIVVILVGLGSSYRGRQDASPMPKTPSAVTVTKPPPRIVPPVHSTASTLPPPPTVTASPLPKRGPIGKLSVVSKVPAQVVRSIVNPVALRVAAWPSRVTEQTVMRRLMLKLSSHARTQIRLLLRQAHVSPYVMTSRLATERPDQSDRSGRTYDVILEQFQTLKGATAPTAQYYVEYKITVMPLPRQRWIVSSFNQMSRP